MYTNGILATDDKLKALGEAGLNEVRFDLGAVNYHPKVLRNAAKFIPVVTVEIPAVPHEKELLLKALPLLCEYGVSNLNLHQLRLTQYNAPKLLEQPYTLLHGEQPTVAESELTALEIMQFVASQGLPIGVNYCNFHFKNRFQKAGFRRMMGKVLLNENEEITQNGFLRLIEATNSGQTSSINLDKLTEGLNNIEYIKISYYGRVIENLTQSIEARTFTISDRDYFIDEGLATQPIVLKGSEISAYTEMMQTKGNTIPDHPLLFEAWRYEFIEQGLREFF
jgi:uncharacterized protein